MNREEILAFIEKTSAEVAKMPAWKRGLLEASMKPMNDEPRKPITTKERAMKIEGVPDGWELVRVGRPRQGELFLSTSGQVVLASGHAAGINHVILRKVEKPKQYRTFANGAEYAPHFDRAVQYQHRDPNVYFRAIGVCQLGVWVQNNEENEFVPWETAFRVWLFKDDGTPFGVEVSE